jgi:DNA replication ATP-dependent helicase Dna2
MGASAREAKGKCFADMKLDPKWIYPTTIQEEIARDEGKGRKVHRFTYAFVRRAREMGEEGSLLSGHMNVGDAITVSVEPHLLALARGYILELDMKRVVLGVDHELGLNGIRVKLAGRIKEEEVVFRIDKDELLGGMGRVRDNLARLFYADGDTRRLELVVDLKPPRFDPYNLSLPSSVQDKLNLNQQEAILKVLHAQDYALILGMPGTGKTTVIAAILRTLVEMGKTILLSSYTHSAVDTILAKLDDEYEGKILRLGNVDKV